MNDELRQFVKEGLAAGLAKPEVEAKLLEAGWPKDEVTGALAGYADVESPVPVPRPRPYLSAADAFVYLVLFFTLYTSAFALVKLLFEFVHHHFPDSGVRPWRSADASIRWATASLVIAFPVFLTLSRKTYLALRDNPDKRNSKVRKWLSYMTLVVASGVLLCDVITLVYYFLAGELSVRFLLKFLIVGVVASAVFGFYIWHLRQDDLDPAQLQPSHPGVRGLVGVVVAAVVASVVGGFFVAGSPGEARGVKLDRQRVQDLTLIANGIDLFWEAEGRLPTELEELSRNRVVLLKSVSDPDTAEPYEYEIKGEKEYALCATFDFENQMAEQRVRAYGSRFWAHDAGRDCFELEAQ
jgi:hypothetical protein